MDQHKESITENNIKSNNHNKNKAPSKIKLNKFMLQPIPLERKLVSHGDANIHQEFNTKHY